jgi:diguanylate cyclase (GGDEF)-like protein/PAS domain S-box-containing protein
MSTSARPVSRGGEGAAAAFGSWKNIIEGMLEAVWVVEPHELRLVAANAAAARLLGTEVADLVGLPVMDLAATPEDVFFWEDVAAGVSDCILSETLVRRRDGGSVPVERRVSRVWLAPGQAVYVVGVRDLSEQRRAEDELEKLVAELRATLESTADGILVTDLDGGIRGYNQHFAALWELPQELLTGRDDAAIYACMHRGVVDEASYTRRQQDIDGTPLLQATDVVMLRSGKVLERVTLPQYGRGRPIGRVYSFRDITQRLASESRLQLAAKVFEASLDAIFVTDADHRIVAANPGCERLLGGEGGSVVGQRLHDLIHDPADEGGVMRAEQMLASQGYWAGELWHRRADGQARPGHVSLVRVADNAGAPLHYIGFFRDLTDKLHDQRRIEQLAYSDALTGLPNRLKLGERIEFALALARRDNSSFALLFLDLDRFKHINDSLGHHVGDRVLVEVAERLKGCLREVDTVARLGGDEFVMLLHEADARGAEATARRVLEALALPFAVGDMNFSVTGSIGVAMYPNDGLTLDDLVKHADTAMYRVKERGRGSFRFYKPQMNVDLLSRMKMDHAMRLALANGAFKLHYQPQVELDSGAIIGAEALIRWRDPEMGDMSPAQFIPVAEESGFIVALGDWVLEEAVRQGARWYRAGRTIAVSINVSALQFQQVNFVERVAGVLAGAGLPAEYLELELTESILLRDADEALQRLRALARLGVRLAIDDFGTGYSSLGYLKRFPIRKLKIDRSFVKGLPEDESDVGIAHAIIQLGKALRLGVIAEGVETEAQRRFLQGAGCDEFQGFLFSAAVTPEAFERLMVAQDGDAGDAPLAARPALA